MRYRRVKSPAEKYERLKEYIIQDAVSKKGMWKDFFGNTHPIFLEMGCGKGQFLLEMAKQHPEYNYIGVEGQERVLLRSAQRAYEADIPNVGFIGEYLKAPGEYFEKGEIQGLFLNFSDPWPKARHAKRRLTHERFLTEYLKFLEKGAEIQFKTDNDDLFEFSVEELKRCGFQITEISYDLHNSDCFAKNITTEYEDKFKSWEKKIKYLKAMV